MAMLPLVIEAPAVPRVQFDLFDSVGLKPLPQEGTGGGIQYDTDYCGPADTWTAPCVDPGSGAKTGRDGIGVAVGTPVTIYHNFTCRLVGAENPKDRAARALELGASRAVEEGFAEIIGSAATTIAGTFSVAHAIAELEQYAGENYGGQAVIHLSRRAATLAIAADVVIRVGDHLETGLGSLVIAGAGYGDAQEPSAPAASTEWGYVTGAVNIFESPVVVNELALERGAGGGYTNEFAALVERIYVPTYECFAGAIQIVTEETP